MKRSSRLTVPEIQKIRLWNRILIVLILVVLLWPGVLVSPNPDWDALRDPRQPISPAGASPYQGTTQRLRVIVSPDTTINAIKLRWKFDTTAMEVLGVDTYLNPFYVIPPGGLVVDNAIGSITFAGALPPPGWNKRAVIAYIDVKAKKQGSYALELQEASRFYRKDRKATPIPANVDPIIAEFR